MTIIPGPLRVATGTGRFRLGPRTSVGYAAPGLEAPGLEAMAGRFRADLERRTGVEATASPDGGDVVLRLGDHPGLDELPAPAGLDPAGAGRDERYALTIGADGISLTARDPAGIARGLSSLLQLAVTAEPEADGTIWLEAATILDAPRFAWRGLSLDVSRRFFDPAQVRRVIDLIALYKLNVLHMHLTDNEAWRIEAGRPERAREPDGTFYTNDELRSLVGYAAERFITIVPEIESPGHAAALVGLNPGLDSGRNVTLRPPGATRGHDSAWLDPDLPGTFEVLSKVFADVAGICPGPFVHVGGDEAWGMPDRAYAAHVARLRSILEDLGKRPIGWQELIRAGGRAGEAIQFWMSPSTFENINVSRMTPAAAALVRENGAASRADLASALDLGIPVIMSPCANCYLDVPYAEASADPAQEPRRRLVGLRNYRAETLSGSFGWDPVTALGPSATAASVAGVEAVVWCETVRDFDDLTFLLLPRLAGAAEKGWGAAGSVTWPEHSAALGGHGRLWEQDGLTYFRAVSVGWA